MERDHLADWQRKVALYGPFLLALYFVATTRWGSFLLPGPPFIGDWLLGALIAHRLWLLVRGGLPALLVPRWLAAATVALLIFSLIRLPMGELSEDALRDSAPYLYAVLVLFGQSYRAIGENLARVLVEGTLVVHAAWVTVTEISPSVASIATPGDSGVLLLEQRADVDGAMLAVLIGLSLDRLVLGRNRLLGAVMTAWGIGVVLQNQSRGSFLAVLAVLLFMVLRWALLWRSSRTRAGEPFRRRLPAPARLALALTVVIGAVAAITVVDETPPALDRLINAGKVAAGADAPKSVLPGEVTEPEPSDSGSNPAPRGNPGGGKGSSAGTTEEPKTEAINTGTETFKARLAGWEEVVDWMYDGGASRMAAGVGFGRHYMQESGADIAFLGPVPDPTVRAIHNIGLNTWARLGTVGLIPLVAIMLIALVAAVKLSARSIDPPILDLFASLLVVTIPVVAMLGVVLESPFGAIPYFWAVGYLGARMVEEGYWRPPPLPDWLRRRQAA